MGGDIEVFRGGKVLGGKVQSPESRVQGPVQLLGYALIWTFKMSGLSIACNSKLPQRIVYLLRM